MGTVYKAFDLALDHDVAAKVIGDAVIAKDGALERFFGEAKILASLRDHPNVVTVYDFGRIGNHQAYLIMELLVGRTLRQLLESDGRIRPRDALEMLEDVASAMTAAHRLRLLHRDLKPENIFLVDSGRGMVAKVLDFGIAKPLSLATTVNGRRETGDRILLGTLEYMSPEQRRGEPPSKAWDIWSLAVVALEMLSGRPPMSTMMPDVGPWRPGHALKDTLPACVNVFNRALSIDPTERPLDADTLVREIASAVRDEPPATGYAYRRRA
jgi:serine/threonine-protein kinase